MGFCQWVILHKNAVNFLGKVPKYENRLAALGCEAVKGKREGTCPSQILAHSIVLTPPSSITMSYVL